MHGISTSMGLAVYLCTYFAGWQ